jgi:hypothetical protein
MCGEFCSMKGVSAYLKKEDRSQKIEARRQKAEVRRQK